MTTPWWKAAVIYQIYPRSFQDSNRDGVGDLPGIIRRLPYLVELGVDAVWISPIFASPMADFGYDISDYTAIAPIFGSMADFDTLLARAHHLGLKLILDFVPNHTSDRHPWFVESRAARTASKRDWYIWRDPAPGGDPPPNNWLSEFGGSAWTFDARTGQYYYHAFLPQQPDLNWRNQEVAWAMHNVMRFWLQKGIDGFRVDVIWHLIKDDQFRDNPVNQAYLAGMPPNQRVLPLYTADLPAVQDVVRGLRRVLDEFPQRLLIGEIYLPIDRLVAYYGQGLAGTHLPFNFALLFAHWDAQTVAALIDEYEATLPPGGWPNWVLGNHDRPRIASRIGTQARIAAMLLLTLRGTPTIYYGDELGLQQIPIPPQQVRDPLEKRAPGIGIGRDGARTPMQWDASNFAGFSTVEPWLPIGDDFRTRNVAQEVCDPASIYQLYRRLIAVRRQFGALSTGNYRRMPTQGDLLLYERRDGEGQILIALNFGPEAILTPPPYISGSGRILVSTFGDRAKEFVNGKIALRR